MSQLLEILGSKYPIIQGPVLQLNDAKMVAAISEAGGYGMLALGSVKDLDKVKRLIADVKELTDKPFGANLMIAMNPNNEAILEILAEAGVKTVTTSAGSPKKSYPKIKELGMQGLHVALMAAQASKAAEGGADGLIVSGTESGGMRTTGLESTNMVLIPLVCDMVEVPVVAAGGIADSRGYRAAMALGAQGVQIGTAFVAAEESGATQAWKEAILACGDGGTLLYPRGRVTSRTIITPELSKFMAEGGDISKQCDIPRGHGAGQVSALISKIRPIKDIIQEMVA
jgi:enoyl-[acyl-carrier protein] reductase II